MRKVRQFWRVIFFCRRDKRGRSTKRRMILGTRDEKVKVNLERDNLFFFFLIIYFMSHPLHIYMFPPGGGIILEKEWCALWSVASCRPTLKTKNPMPMYRGKKREYRWTAWWWMILPGSRTSSSYCHALYLLSLTWTWTSSPFHSQVLPLFPFSLQILKFSPCINVFSLYLCMPFILTRPPPRISIFLLYQCYSRIFVSSLCLCSPLKSTFRHLCSSLTIMFPCHINLLLSYLSPLL